mmetsp:Transcript_5420/g.7974  ORF Transcript_5420/g.7974 Transcript_5420/m.7974 type:complete len:564 (+) Transcript_5420:67-1758(+)
MEDKFAKYRAAPRRHPSPQKSAESKGRERSGSIDSEKASSKTWMLTAYKSSNSSSTNPTRPSRQSSAASASIKKSINVSNEEDISANNTERKNPSTSIPTRSKNQTQEEEKNKSKMKLSEKDEMKKDEEAKSLAEKRSFKRARRLDAGRPRPSNRGKSKMYALLDLDGTLFHMMPDRELPGNVIHVTEAVVPLPEGAMQQLVAKRTQNKCKTAAENEVLARIDVDDQTRHVMAVRRGTHRLLASLRAAKVDVRVVTANLLGDVAVKALTDREDADIAAQVATQAQNYLQQAQNIDLSQEILKGWTGAPDVGVTVVVDRSPGAKRLPDDIVDALRDDPRHTKLVILDDNPTAWEARAIDFIWLVPQFDVRKPLTRTQLDEELSLLDGFSDRCINFFSPQPPLLKSKSSQDSFACKSTALHSKNNHLGNEDLSSSTVSTSEPISKPPKPTELVQLKPTRRAPLRNSSIAAGGGRKYYQPAEDDLDDDDENDKYELLEKEIEMAYNEDDDDDDDDPDWTQVLKASRASRARSKRRRRSQDDDVADAAVDPAIGDSDDEELLGCGAL